MMFFFFFDLRVSYRHDEWFCFRIGREFLGILEQHLFEVFLQRGIHLERILGLERDLLATFVVFDGVFDEFSELSKEPLFLVFLDL
tara:strand:- start:191 stop:448 length:258 start_codon:yes stop_codon:yes gene_type:complete